MCGRYALWELRALSEQYDVPPREFAALEEKLHERYNIAPTQTEPVITESNGQRHLELMRWGFIAPWMKSSRDTFKYSTFNARSEDIFDKPTWRRAIRQSRCLIPANGFYEWKSTQEGKQPFFIRPKDQELFAFAGVYGAWKDAEGLEWHTYSIVTTRPNKEMAQIHNRMPVILRRKDEERWLDPNNVEPVTIASIMQPYKDGGLSIDKVDKKVNSSRIDDSSLVLPLNSK